MDANRFDQLSRKVARQTDRRGLLRAAVGGGLGLLGVTALRREASADVGFEGDVCTTGADCKSGLICEGNSTGLLGGSLAGTPYGPGVDIQLVNGSTGRCRYHSGDRCAKVDQSCQRTSDCCNGLGLTCHNKKCKR